MQWEFPKLYIRKSCNDFLMLLILLKLFLQHSLEALFLSHIDSNMNTSGQHLPWHKFAVSQGSRLVCFRQIPVGSQMSVSKAYVQLGCFSYTAINALWSSVFIEGEGKALLVITMFAQPLSNYSNRPLDPLAMGKAASLAYKLAEQQTHLGPYWAPVSQ